MTVLTVTQGTLFEIKIGGICKKCCPVLPKHLYKERLCEMALLRQFVRESILHGKRLNSYRALDAVISLSF